MFVKIGSRGEDVVLVQRALIKHGYAVAHDGIFGNNTKTAVVKFQSSKGLVPDGIVGNDTYDALKANPKESKTGTPWLTLAKNEIGVHEVYNESRVHYYWKASKLSGLAKFPATQIPWCFDGEMEILTENGFIKFKDLGPGTKVYQVDDDCNISITEPIKIIKQEYDGEWNQFESYSDTYICTANHKWWGYKGSRKIADYHELSDLTKVGMRIPKIRGAEWFDGCNISDDDIIKLVMYITDGTLRKCETFDLQISKPRKLEYCDRVGLHMNAYTQKKAYGPKTTKPLSVYSYKIPKEHIDLFTSNKSISWEFIRDLNEAQAKLFLDTFAMFDGTPVGCAINNPNACYYYSNHKTTVDQIQYLLLKRGRISRFEYSTSKLSGNPSYTCVDSNTQNQSTIVRGDSIKSFNDKRMMYCVEVPNHKIVVRGINGRSPLITGNCSGFANAMMELSNIRSARTDGAKNWLGWGVELEEPCDGCIVVFTRKGGGHVGIVVGEDDKGNLLVLGGNQGNMVCVKSFSRSRVTGYRYPEGYTPSKELSNGNGTELSDDEA